MARLFATTRGAFVPFPWPSSANAIALAVAVRFSIFDDAADSDLSNSEENGRM